MNGISAITETITAPLSGRRSFLKLLSRSMFGAAAVATGVGGIKRAQAAEEDFAPLWTNAQVLIGNSPADQYPSSVIKCPFFFENGRFAHAYHTLDLSMLRTTGRVTGSITHQNDTIHPDFSASIAGIVTQGTDGPQYFLVAGEGPVTGGLGFFQSVTKAIVRCKYKVVVDRQGDILLISCVDCVAILVRNTPAKA
jgi:hypothetical protein